MYVLILIFFSGFNSQSGVSAIEVSGAYASRQQCEAAGAEAKTNAQTEWYGITGGGIGGFVCVPKP